ncbi:DUF202 domain-containing protein [Actinotalea sp. M2MS4P-6]|uniref:DUF202 domain-containing protein n=1 Tax=Actinotalea sp. M2MS4P-6 TaxID=2983762 RepID=UPI0021E35894|nr:DUF202 domain-containing protein [Actinotalea sp. M2MS4P-6]MCV2395162.1 DUF202 domain-containing protein [Actinotalea sp. M2MS4P-6]
MRFDPGLQPERTALAWNRTALSIVVGGLVALRVLPALVGAVGLVLAVFVVVAGAGLGLLAHVRSRRTTGRLVAGAGALPDGRLPAVVATVATGIAVIAVGVVAAAVIAGRP